MTATTPVPTITHGPPRVPRERARPPLGVVVACAAWYVLGALLVTTGLGAWDPLSSGEGAGYLGGEVVSGAVGAAPTALPLLAGVAVLLLAGLLWLGLGFAAYGLGALGALAVVGTATTGSWAALVAAACLLGGTAPLVGPASYDFLRGRAR